MLPSKVTSQMAQKRMEQNACNKRIISSSKKSSDAPFQLSVNGRPFFNSRWKCRKIFLTANTSNGSRTAIIYLTRRTLCRQLILYYSSSTKLPPQSITLTFFISFTFTAPTSPFICCTKKPRMHRDITSSGFSNNRCPRLQ